MLKQHVDAAVRWIAAEGHVGCLLPFAFGGQVHGVLDLCRSGIEPPGETVGIHGEFRIDVVSVVVGAEAVDVRGIIVRNGGQRLELRFAIRPGALALDEQDEPIEFVLNVFSLCEFQARRARARWRQGPDQLPARKASFFIASRCAAAFGIDDCWAVSATPEPASKAAASDVRVMNLKKAIFMSVAPCRFP